MPTPTNVETPATYKSLALRMPTDRVEPTPTLNSRLFTVAIPVISWLTNNVSVIDTIPRNVVSPTTVRAPPTITSLVVVNPVRVVRPVTVRFVLIATFSASIRPLESNSVLVVRIPICDCSASNCWNVVIPDTVRSPSIYTSPVNVVNPTNVLMPVTYRAPSPRLVPNEPKPTVAIPARNVLTSRSSISASVALRSPTVATPMFASVALKKPTVEVPTTSSVMLAKPMLPLVILAVPPMSTTTSPWKSAEPVTTKSWVVMIPALISSESIKSVSSSRIVPTPANRKLVVVRPDTLMSAFTSMLDSNVDIPATSSVPRRAVSSNTVRSVLKVSTEFKNSVNALSA